jgi:hypothetical protein
MSDDYLNIDLLPEEASLFADHPDICPICDAPVSHQEEGAFEFECGAFLVRELEGPVWKLACPSA